MVLRPVVLIGEIHAMDSLLTYESSSSSNSDGEAWTETQPPSKKLAIEQMPGLVTQEDDALMDRPASDPEVSDSNDGAPKFGSEGFHSTDRDQLDKNELEEGGSIKMETDAFGGSGNMHTTFPLPVVVGGKRNPYALNIRDLNPRMRFLGIGKDILHAESKSGKAEGHALPFDLRQSPRKSARYVCCYICLLLSSRSEAAHACLIVVKSMHS